MSSDWWTADASPGTSPPHALCTVHTQSSWLKAHGSKLNREVILLRVQRSLTAGGNKDREGNDCRVFKVAITLRACERIGEAKLAHTISGVCAARQAQQAVVAGAAFSILSQALRVMHVVTAERDDYYSCDSDFFADANPFWPPFFGVYGDNHEPADFLGSTPSKTFSENRDRRPGHRHGRDIDGPPQGGGWR